MADAGQPQPLSQRLRIPRPLIVSRPVGTTPVLGVTLQRPTQSEHRNPLPLEALTNVLI
jgi:hypothetical protein